MKKAGISAIISAFLMCSFANATSKCNYDFTYGYADLVDQIIPSVVNISTVSIKERTISPIEDFFGMHGFGSIFPHVPQGGKKIKQKSTALGSGFFIDKDGHIVTNYHVIKDATAITIKTHDGKEYKAKIIGSDEKSDLAVLKAETPGVKNFAKFGVSNEARIGDKVLAIGNPFGLGGTVTTGIVSAKSRSIGQSAYDDFIQTDAPINQGNSGGPMFNLCGEVIGINTAILSPSGGSVGIGFAIASDSAVNIIEKLKNKQKITRAWLGVEIQTLTEEMAEALGVKKNEGVYVNGVAKDSPAQKAGIKTGDIIVAVDDKKAENMQSVTSYIGSRKPDSKVNVEIKRGGKKMNIDVILKESKSDNNEMDRLKSDKSDAKNTLGLVVENLTKDRRLELRIPDEISGVVIVDVKNEILAEFGEVKTGDILTHVNGNEIKNTSDMEKAAKIVKASGKRHVVFKIWRQGVHISLGVPIK
ncbi:Do family serine endopeptidase [Candidatus Deianiraea vastatrix]|uniref:Periplasmic serine endoprotease DegP-like n=1 Tax=Candidatus Deianiraea vastatrix TaxID=2163644 RepID=A0A5B8XIQ6_9RICK|nr:Do family serine endopeptidase [Candidatus Deianiraea vastatrix]QED23527.1 Putative periplasmic serine endoprotease DegP-like precursor [Candidatus Deianiraea vastatrix]